MTRSEAVVLSMLVVVAIIAVVLVAGDLPAVVLRHTVAAIDSLPAGY